MRKDDDGNMKPLMLSELVMSAQTALINFGDMVVWVKTMEPGYEYNERHSQPASDIPSVYPSDEAGVRYGNTGDVFVISVERNEQEKQD